MYTAGLSGSPRLHSRQVRPDLSPRLLFGVVDGGRRGVIKIIPRDTTRIFSIVPIPTRHTLLHKFGSKSNVRAGCGKYVLTLDQHEDWTSNFYWRDADGDVT